MVFSSRSPWKRKEIKLFARESSQQAKEEQEIFLGFHLSITTTSMESKLAKSYNKFFYFSYGFSNTQEESKKKENKLAWIVQ